MASTHHSSTAQQQLQLRKSGPARGPVEGAEKFHKGLEDVRCVFKSDRCEKP